MEERLMLARERLLELTEECKQTLPGDWQDFFQKSIKFANLLIKVYDNDDTAFYKEVNSYGHFDFESMLAERIMPLPIDQRYNEEDMKRIVYVLKPLL